MREAIRTRNMMDSVDFHIPAVFAAREVIKLARKKQLRKGVEGGEAKGGSIR